MKLTYFTIALSMIFSWQLSAEVLPYNQDTLKKAKDEGKDIIVFCGGSDWLPNHENYLKTFQQAEKNSKKEKAIWAFYDMKDQPTEEERKAIKPPLKIWSFPALQMVDCENRPLYNKDRVSLGLVKRSEKLLEKMVSIRKKRDMIWEKADKAKGLEKATLIGEGLDCLEWEVGKKYKAKINEIKREDPKDVIGYHFKYTMWHLNIAEGIVNAKLKDKKYDEANRLLDEKLRLKVLNPYQRQLLIVGKYKVALAQGKQDLAMSLLKKAADVDPTSPFGKGCLNQIKYYTAPVYLPSLSWSTLDNRPVWLPMIVEVQKEIKEPGKYKIDFKHRAGHTKFRNPKIRIGPKVLQQIDGERRVFEFNLSEVPKGKIILEVESQGTGWFDGKGDIIITKQ